MIFTVGKVDVYMKAWEQNGEIIKKGATEEYQGGSVWRSREQAQRVADKNPGFAVFGVEAVWNVDTEPQPGSSFHNLLIDAKVIPLDG